MRSDPRILPAAAGDCGPAPPAAAPRPANPRAGPVDDVAGIAAPIVLDTNVWLDWLVFDDPAIGTLRQALRAGVQPVASAAMRAELADVLARPQFALDAAAQARCLQRFDRWVVPCEAGTPATAPALRCSDPDDQIFIDLARTRRAVALLTRDKALLRLARRAREAGLTICRPADFRAPRP